MGDITLPYNVHTHLAYYYANFVLWTRKMSHLRAWTSSSYCFPLRRSIGTALPFSIANTAMCRMSAKPNLFCLLIFIYDHKICIKRVPQRMSPRRNWDSPNPSLASECVPPPVTKEGGAHSPAGEGLEESQFRRLEKSLALSTVSMTVLNIK